MYRIILFILVNGLFGAVQAFGASHGVILQYHHIASDTPRATTVAPELFERQMAFLRDNGFTLWPLSRLVDHLQADKPVPDGVVVITFDDAYDNIHDIAAPILQRMQFPFTVFVSTAFVDRRQRGYMSWDQLRALQKKGAELANHTHTHLHMLRLQAGESERQWLARLRGEIETTEQLLEKETGTQRRFLAYPYGEADEQVIALVKSLGYVGFGQQSGPVDKVGLASGMAPRFPFNNDYADMTEFQHKSSSVPLPMRSMQASPMLWTTAGRPQLTMQVSDRVRSLQCFASRQGAIAVDKKADNHFVIQAGKSIPVGRSRYNCTAPVDAQAEVLTLQLRPRFYWYTHQWIRKQDDGSWYPEP